MRKTKLFSIVITLILWAFMYYMALPPINIKSNAFWNFCISLLVVGVVINSPIFIKNLVANKTYIDFRTIGKPTKCVLLIFAALVIVYAGGSILSSPILRASSYRELITIESGDFAEDIKEVDYSTIPLLDDQSAALLAERIMGSMIDMVSQYEVSTYFSQINYNNTPYRVTPLEYGSNIKWFTNRSTGIPAYIKIDMATQNTELIRLEEGITISPSELFGRNLDRYLRFRYPTAMFMSKSFEIDDEGTPYWIAPVSDKTIGLFGGEDIKGAVLLNAITGEHQYYDVEDVPSWVDRVYTANLLMQQYNYYGTLVHGFINSVLSQKDCLQTTEGYNYIALDNDVWVYTGITSVTGDESIVGFVLMNQRTKETKYYQVSGAKEISAMSSAEGQVQNLSYVATFPLLINVEGEPTYILALKDSAGLVKKYAMVNIEKYQIVAIGDSILECERNYSQLMSDNGIETQSSADEIERLGTVENIWDVVIDGNTNYYFMISGSDELFQIPVKENVNVLKVNVGDSVTITGISLLEDEVIEISEIKVNN